MRPKMGNLRRGPTNLIMTFLGVGQKAPTDRYCHFGIFRSKNVYARDRLATFGPLLNVANQFGNLLCVFCFGPHETFHLPMVAYECAQVDPFLPRIIPCGINWSGPFEPQRWRIICWSLSCVSPFRVHEPAFGSHFGPHGDFPHLPHASLSNVE